MNQYKNKESEQPSLLVSYW